MGEKGEGSGGKGEGTGNGVPPCPPPQEGRFFILGLSVCPPGLEGGWYSDIFMHA